MNVKQVLAHLAKWLAVGATEGERGALIRVAGLRDHKTSGSRPPSGPLLCQLWQTWTHAGDRVRNTGSEDNWSHPLFPLHLVPCFRQSVIHCLIGNPTWI